MQTFGIGEVQLRIEREAEVIAPTAGEVTWVQEREKKFRTDDPAHVLAVPYRCHRWHSFETMWTCKHAMWTWEHGHVDVQVGLIKSDGMAAQLKVEQKDDKPYITKVVLTVDPARTECTSGGGC